MTDASYLVGGRYLLGEPLGRGGMAEVRSAIDQRLGRSVAVKRLNPNLAAEPSSQTRFKREAHAAASLNHPNIASVFDTGSDRDDASGIDIPFLVMELVEGRTLRAVLRDGPPLGAERALEVVAQVLAALTHSHAGGIVHRDIKPANVMLTPAGEVKVMDFGIARAADDSTTSLTQTSAVIGTAQYLSPEQARGENVDLRSDLYSTGCVLYELLVNRPPFTGESSVSLAYQHVNADPVPPSAVDPSLSPEVDAIVLRALAKDATDRYESAAQMRGDIEQVLASGRVHAGSGFPAGVATGAGTAVLGAVPAAVAAPAAADPTTTFPPTAAAVAPPAVAEVDRVPAQEPERRRRGLVVGLVLAALLLVGLGALLLPGWLGDDTPVARQVSVPDVTGSSRAEADSALRNAGLVPQFVNVKGDNDDTVDTVVGQDPGPEAQAAAGSTVALEVNIGPDSARIPTGLVGREADDAEERLNKAGFETVRTERATSQPDSAEEGDVVGVEPAEGALAPLDEEVVLVVARAPRTSGTPTSAAPEPTPTPTPSSAEPSESGTSSPEPTDEPDDDTPSRPSASPTPGTGRPSATRTQQGRAQAANPTSDDGDDDD